MVRDVKVSINAAKTATGIGFGFPLILQGKAETEIPYTECSSIEEVIKAVGVIKSTDIESAVSAKTAKAKESNIYKAAILLLMQDNAPETVAVCASAETATTAIGKILHKGFRQIIVVSNSAEGEDSRKAISDYVETTEKQYFTSVSNVSELSGSNAVSGNDRTVVMVHSDENAVVAFPEAALVGATSGRPAGSFTYKNLMLKGITAKVLSDAELKAIHDAHAMAFVIKCGEGVTSDGKATSGEYVDIIDSQDYVVGRIEHETQQLLNHADKIPYDNKGIAMLENVCVNVLKDAANNGMIAEDENGAPDYSVNYKPRSETKQPDRAARKYVEGSFRFALAGAVHTVEVKGTIEI